ncbi:MAG: phosphotransferase family protein [Candidatus Azotimanducaceae bacterium]
MALSLNEFAVRLVDSRFTLVSGKRLLGGVSADVFVLQVKDSKGQETQWVLRQNKSDEDQTAARAAILREYELTCTLHKQGFCVPEPLNICLNAVEYGGPFWVMTYIPGSTDLGNGHLATRLETMAESLTQIHNVPVGALPKLPDRTNPVPELYDYLPAGPDWLALRAGLDGNHFCEYQGAPALLHGDFWAGNLIWDQDRLVGILDWEDAAIGDPMCDLAAARLELLWRFDHKTVQRFTQHYAERLPIHPWRLALWQVFVGSAALKFMGDWGLDETLVNHMRRLSATFIENSSYQVLTIDPKTQPLFKTPNF